MGKNVIDQEALHALEMKQGAEAANMHHEPMIVHKLWNKHRTELVSYDRSGHGGGDRRLHDKIFLNPDAPDPMRHAAGSRDGAMSILIGVAARKSIESGHPVRIAELIDLEPRARRI